MHTSPTDTPAHRSDARESTAKRLVNAIAPHHGVTIISPSELKALFGSPKEFALLDVRGQGAFSEKNIFQATTLPLGQLELLLATALPRRDVKVVIVSGEHDELSARAARRMQSFGYSDMSILEGGVEAWERAGLPTYCGTHVRSKAFSEVLEEELHVPWIDFAELERQLQIGNPVAIFDSRSFPEYQRVTVPGAKSLAGAELVRHIHDQVPDPATLVIVTCGGRTRSIIGAQALINAGVANRVVSLKDGTMGLRRDALPLEAGASRRPVDPSADSLAWARGASSRIAERLRIRTLEPAEYAAWQRDPARTFYVFDVRTPEEYAAGHLAGSISAQGGQLVQEIDTYAPVWNARVVLVDDEHLIRARMTASWLLQMGCKEVVVRALGDEPLELGPQPQKVWGLATTGGARHFPDLSVEDLAAGLERKSMTVVDLAPSPQYKAGHIPGAHFVTRARLAERLPQLPSRDTLVLTSEDGLIARLAAADLAAQGIAASVLAGGTRAWQAAGRPLSPGFECVNDVIDDAWLPPPQRDGDVHVAITEYLEWEVALPKQVALDPSVKFHIAKMERTS